MGVQSIDHHLSDSLVRFNTVGNALSLVAVIYEAHPFDFALHFVLK